jgi:ubiquinone/menaquinone biosynthesis C-methylase UbiE
MSGGYDEVQDFAEKMHVLGDISYWINDVLGGSEPNRALEIGGSGGILAGLFADRFCHTICTDIVDWDLKYNGEGMKLISEKFARNGYRFPLGRMKYIPADAQNLFFRDNWFDVVFSQNAFEHIPDPGKALREAIRVTRPGGMIYVRFDPVWTADSGSHFLHSIGSPWTHLIEPDNIVTEMMRTNGASSYEIASYKSDMNRLSVRYYQEILPAVVAELGCTMPFHTSWSGVVDNEFLNHPNLQKAASKLNLAPDDLLVRGFLFVIRKG